ncbi:MAG: cytidylate kinase-like family protein [Clostridiales bacterium]|nr:cytidylate kinase-like family protein [Clostridiales bacterium]
MLQSEYILKAASAGDSVFIGRCADYVLGQAGIPRISIFICALFADRVSRKAEISVLTLLSLFLFDL